MKPSCNSTVSCEPHSIKQFTVLNPEAPIINCITVSPMLQLCLICFLAFPNFLLIMLVFVIFRNALYRYFYYVHFLCTEILHNYDKI